MVADLAHHLSHPGVAVVAIAPQKLDKIAHRKIVSLRRAWHARTSAQPERRQGELPMYQRGCGFLPRITQACTRFLCATCDKLKKNRADWVFCKCEARPSHVNYQLTKLPDYKIRPCLNSSTCTC